MSNYFTIHIGSKLQHIWGWHQCLELKLKSDIEDEVQNCGSNGLWHGFARNKASCWKRTRKQVEYTHNSTMLQQNRRNMYFVVFLNYKCLKYHPPVYMPKSKPNRQSTVNCVFSQK